MPTLPTRVILPEQQFTSKSVNVEKYSYIMATLRTLMENRLYM